jgi:outer membrane protein OmpA-like peptidoglycan-associated protein/Tfp pilus assembly protein PilF
MKWLILFLVCVCFQVVFAQSPPYSSKNKKAIVQYEMGKRFLALRKFNEAIFCFENAAEKDKRFVEAYIALAGCYRILRDDSKVKIYLLSAFSLKPNMPENVYEYYFLASLLMKEGDYPNAARYLDQFFSYHPSDMRVIPSAKRMLANCQYAQQAIKNPLKFSPEILPSPLNRFRNQYFPSLTADGQFLLYTVRNPTGMNEQEDLYFSEKWKTGWTVPQQVSTRINTKENEGAATISGDGKTMVYTYCTPTNGCDLYITRKVGKEWTQPASIGSQINTRLWESHPALSADGRTLYFASERMGGFGKEDIWVTEIDSSNNWSKPVNLGPSVNTADSDYTPYIHPNGTSLYFSSRGWPGMGGADLFWSEKKGDSAWSVPQNLGYPVNTFADELGLAVSSDFSVGYFSKDVADNQGRYISMLYSFQVPESMKSETRCIYLKGRVLDDSTGFPLKAKVELVNLQTGKIEQNVFSDGQNGSYLLVVSSKKNYGLFVSALGYVYQSLHFNSSEEAIDNQESFDIRLKPLRQNAQTVLRNLFFESGKYTLDSASVTELLKLVKLVQDNKLKIEISGHTDDVGSPQENKTLSEKRAEAVYLFLLQKGIEKDRLRYRGYGESRPLEDNTSEAGKKNNRRIEIKILN